MSDLIWNDLFIEIDKYFQANNLNSYDGYASKPVANDPTSFPYYYFQLESENDIDIFDKDGLNFNDGNEPQTTFDIYIGTISPDATDITLLSAETEAFGAQKAIRTELYSWAVINEDGINYPWHNCIYKMTINNITKEIEQTGTMGASKYKMNITAYYNKTGV